MSTSLPLDYGRCAAHDCERRNTCARYTSRPADARLTYVDRYCELGREQEGYIRVREEYAA